MSHIFMIFRHMKHLDVGDGHSLKYELWGNPEGQNIVFLHGGPGFGYREEDKQFFSSELHNVLFFDQRGAGGSMPQGRLENNQTNFLVADVISLMDHVGMESATMFGGSWGSSMALMIAIKHPDRVDDLVLRGLFPANRSCVMEMVSETVIEKFNAQYSRFMAIDANATRQNFLNIYYNLLSTGTKEEKLNAAREWSTYCAFLGGIKLPPEAPVDTNHSLLTIWYAMNDFFVENDYILNNANEISCEAYLVHGDKDYLCPVKYALELQKRMRQLQLEVVDAGHSSMDPEIFSRLKKRMLNY